LTAWERLVLVVEVLATYCAVRWTVRGNDLPQVLVRLRGEWSSVGSPRELLASVSDDEDGLVPGSRLGYIVSRVLSILPTDSRCLMRSLVLTRLLARRGLPSSLVIGVSASPDFAAHAWVEYRGRPLLPAHQPTFARLVEL
jgi:Transglutaminase-like superfamily